MLKPTLLQIVILVERPIDEPNAYGCVSLTNQDPLRPNECYFQQIDWVVNRAAELGLYVALLPTWGDKVNLAWGPGPVIFNVDNARAYGNYIGTRYRNATNVVWMLGGDREVANDTQLAIWNAMATGITEGVALPNDQIFITYHPAGWRATSSWFHTNPLFDMNSWQSGHTWRDIEIWDWITKDYALMPAKPTLDLEPNYEDHPINWDPANGYFRDYDVRRQLYRSVFAGGCGVTYGHHSVWQLYDVDKPGWASPDRYWREALNRPGATQLIHLRRLIESRPYMIRIPDQQVLASSAGTAINHLRATRGSDGSYAFVYIPTTQTVTVAMSKITGAEVRAWWYDPRTGQSTLIGVFPNTGTRQFTTPADGPDWVLVLDDAARISTLPGTSEVSASLWTTGWRRP